MGFLARKIYLSCDRATVSRWADYLNAHEEECRTALANEGVRRELWWVGADEEGLFIVGALDVDDIERAWAVFNKSTLSVDQAHREFMRHWGRRVDIQIDDACIPAFPEHELLIDVQPGSD